MFLKEILKRKSTSLLTPNLETCSDHVFKRTEQTSSSPLQIQHHGSILTSLSGDSFFAAAAILISLYLIMMRCVDRRGSLTQCSGRFPSVRRYVTKRDFGSTVNGQTIRLLSCFVVLLYYPCKQSGIWTLHLNKLVNLFFYRIITCTNNTFCFLMSSIFFFKWIWTCKRPLLHHDF